MVGLDEQCRLQVLVRKVEVGVISYIDPAGIKHRKLL